MYLDNYNIYNLKELIIQYEEDESYIAKNEELHREFMKTEKFSKEEHYIAIAAIKERVLQALAKQMTEFFLNKEMGIFNEKPQGSGFFQNIFSIFSNDQKYQLLPLFYNYDLTTNRSIFFDKQRIRDYFFSVFNIMLENEKIELEELKQKYKFDNSLKYAQMYPIYDKIMSLTVKLS